MSQISVHGMASASISPEIAIAKLVVEFTGTDHPATLARAKQAHKTVMTSAEIMLHNGQATRVVSPTVRNWVFDEWLHLDSGHSERRATHYRAGTSVDIWFTDLAVLGGWLAEVAKIIGVEVRGVVWDLTEATRETTMRTVRMEAARDAVQRAADYADALGLGDVRLSGIYELTSPADDREDAPPLRPGPHGTEISVELRPEDITLSALVRAEFDAD